MELKTTLDEKKAQLQVYRTIYQDATSHQQDLLQLKDKIESLHQPSEQSKQQLATITTRHGNVLKRAQVRFYFIRVGSLNLKHPQFTGS